jgi:hypothetical protein
MEKSEFLKEISSMTREQIQEKLNKECKRVKMICPAVYIKKRSSKDTTKKEV